MLRIVHANALPPLLDALASELRAAPAGLAEIEHILVPSVGLRRWLTLGLAERLGSLAFTSMPLPARFAQQMCALLLDEEPDPRHERDVLIWRIWRELGSADADAPFEHLRRYLADDPGGIRRHQLARTLAARYDDYLLYRPDLVLGWEKTPGRTLGEDETWQRALWLRLVQSAGERHLARRLADGLERLAGPQCPEGLPARITAFGPTTLPPAFLHLLQGLARWIPVTLYWMAPRGEQGGRPSPLLASLGGVAEDFEVLLADLAGYTELEHRSLPRTIPTGDRVLPRLQRRLLGAEPHSDVPAPIDAEDRSLVVHAAYSPRRELEILREEVLFALDADPTLSPSDIAILLAAPETHAPLVDAVFGLEHDGLARLPYHVSDRGLERGNELVRAFVDLLALPDTRLERSVVLDFLRRRPVQRRFGLDETDVLAIRNWCEELQVRWGIDAAERVEDHGLPADEGHGFGVALERLLLGHACGDLETPVLGRLPAGLAGEGRAAVLGHFADFCSLLFRRVREWRQELTPPQWERSLRDAVLGLLAPGDEREEDGLRVLLAEIAALFDRCRQAELDEPLPLEAVRTELAARLQDEAHASPFVDGRLTIGALKPMRSIPFRMICVAGLDQDSFPRRDAPPSFDLIRACPRAGDRTIRGDDRYLFLETLLAARDRLVLSYTAFSSRDGSPRPPSVCLAELLDELDTEQIGPDGELARDFVQIEHPLHPTSVRYFDGTTPRLFSHRRDHVTASEHARGERRPEPPWCEATGRADPDAAPDASAPHVVEFERLVRFWQHPCAFYLRECLQLELPREAGPEDEEEPMQLVGLGRHRAAERILLRRWVRGESVPHGSEDEKQLLELGGELPPGGLGAVAFERLAEEVARPGATLAALTRVEPRGFTLEVPGYRIVGALDGLHTEGRVAVRPGRVRPKDRISLWLHHLALALCVQQGQFDHPVRSELLARTERVRFGALEEDAAEILKWLCLGFEQGLLRPLPVLPLASAAFAEQEHKYRQGAKNLRKEPIDAARDCWNPDEYSRSENDAGDPALQLCFRGRDPFEPERDFAELAHLLWDPLLSEETREAW